MSNVNIALCFQSYDLLAEDSKQKPNNDEGSILCDFNYFDRDGDKALCFWSIRTQYQAATALQTAS